MPKDEIIQSLKNALKELGVEDSEPQIERPKDTSRGDFSSNVAMSFFSNSEFRVQNAEFKNPLEMARKIVKILNTKPARNASINVAGGYKIPDTFSKVEAVKPGFINFYLSNEYLQNQVKNIILKGELYGQSKLNKGKKASVEFVSANPTGPLHIGNARGGPLGDVIANVLAKTGYKVTREYLHNNVGGQVERLGETIYFTIHPDQKSEDYEVQYQGDYIKELSQNVKEEMSRQEDLSERKFIEKAGEIAVEILLIEILKDCNDMGIKYDVVRKESDLRKEVSQVLPKIKKYLKERDGAVWFAPNDEFLKDRETVVKKSDGEFTYFASDIVYHNEKLSKNDLVVDVLGANHSGHAPRLKAVAKALGYNPDALRVILYQWIRLKRGNEILKMSKRSGTFVTAREVLDEVGKDAFRFFLLKNGSETHMDFDLELAKKQASENPVFYVQYAYTRICSIFAKVKSQKSKVKSNSFSSADLSLLTGAEEIVLIRHLLKLPELIEEVSSTFAVHTFTNYALDLATLFHKFYEAHTVLSKDEKLTSARLALLEATRITLKNTLDLLGVSAPEHM